jgi:hypothetical protein
MERYNIRNLQREIRKRLPEEESTLLDPYANWKLPCGPDTALLLRREILPADKLQSTAVLMGRNPTNDHIVSVIRKIDSKAKALIHWHGKGESEDKWQYRQPQHIREPVQRIRSLPERFTEEIRLLDMIVDPKYALSLSPSQKFASGDLRH